jgi:hypothetical protein
VATVNIAAIRETHGHVMQTGEQLAIYRIDCIPETHKALLDFQTETDSVIFKIDYILDTQKPISDIPNETDSTIFKMNCISDTSKLISDFQGGTASEIRNQTMFYVRRKRHLVGLFMKMAVFWFVPPRGLVVFNRRFRDTCFSVIRAIAMMKKKTTSSHENFKSCSGLFTAASVS